MRRCVSVLLAGTLALTACGGSGSTGTTASKDATSTSAAQGITTTTSAKTKTIDAAQVLAGLKSKMSSITESIVYTADSDPNKLLGRPGQYSSKAGYHDARVSAKDIEFVIEPFDVRKGGDIEVFSDEAGAQKRAEYIGAIVNQPGSGVFGGPQYIHLKGRVLLRVSGALSPSVDAEYERAITAVVG